MSDDGIKALLALSGGDMRKILNTLQSTWLAYKKVNENNVYTCVGHPLRNDIANIMEWLLNEEDFTVIYQSILFKNIFKYYYCDSNIFHNYNKSEIKDLKNAKGLALSDILTEIHTFIHRSKFSFCFALNFL